MGCPRPCVRAAAVNFPVAPTFRRETWSRLPRRPSGWTDVVADMREVTFLDSSGLHVLLAHHRRAAEHGGRFSIIDGDGPVARVLALTGMNAVFDHAPSD